MNHDALTRRPTSRGAMVLRSPAILTTTESPPRRNTTPSCPLMGPDNTRTWSSLCRLTWLSSWAACVWTCPFRNCHFPEQESNEPSNQEVLYPPSSCRALFMIAFCIPDGMHRKLIAFGLLLCVCIFPKDHKADTQHITMLMLPLVPDAAPPAG